MADPAGDLDTVPLSLSLRVNSACERFESEWKRGNRPTIERYLEAEGTGLVDEIASALRLDIPVLVAVPEHRFLEWLCFCHGMGVKLPCRNDSLWNWWNAMIVGEPLSEPRRRKSVCEASK